jgi:tetratricopeptide (TPR) repeat protein
MLIPFIENLAPQHFSFWSPPAGATVLVGAERQPLALPDMPLPLHRDDLKDIPPSDAAIGQGLYDYLRQFPDCFGNKVYAGLLRDAYPHFITDLAAHAVMLDAKQVEPAYVVRKLTALKILWLIEPHNRGLLLQLCRGYFELALEFAALASCREHLREAMRFGQELLALDPHEITALSLLAEIDLLFGDIPGAVGKWQRLAAQIGDPSLQAHIEARLTACTGAAESATTLVDDLEAVAEALRLHGLGDDRQATFVLERIEARGHLPSALPSADFYWLLGVCRQGCGDTGGAVAALHQALALEPGHPSAQAVLETL